MSAGTIALTNNSATVTGTGTSFTTELKSGDFVYVTVGGAPYTLVASSVTSDTQLTLAVAFDGPTTTGLAWNAVPASLQVAITQKILNDFAQVARGRILDFQNWQKIYSSDQSVTVTRPDRTTFTGPSWGYMATQFGNMLTKADNLASVADKAVARTNLGLGDSSTKNVGTTANTVMAGDAGLLKSGGTMAAAISFATRAVYGQTAANMGMQGSSRAAVFPISTTQSVRMICDSAAPVPNQGTATITFPVSFASAPGSVIPSNGNAAVASTLFMGITSISTSGFTVFITNRDGTPVTSQVQINYTAIGVVNT